METKTDGEMARLGQVLELTKELIACAELSDVDEWERIRKYIHARFNVDLPSHPQA